MKALKVILPFIFLAAGAGVAFVLVAARPEIEPVQPETKPVAVEVMEPDVRSHRFHIVSQGTVVPVREVALSSEVRGTIMDVHPAVSPGFRVGKGEILYRIDTRDYELAFVRATASLKQAEAALAMEVAQSAIARKEWDSLGAGRESNPLVLREPQLAEAEARREAAEADLELARTNLDRCAITAPFDGVIVSKSAEVGQYVNAGSLLVRLYDISEFEVRLPIRLTDLRFLPFLVGDRPADGLISQVAVELTGELGGREANWKGRVVQLDTSLDPVTRMASLIVRIDDPLKSSAHPAPLTNGLFVRARILGISRDQVIELPRSVLRGDNRIFVVDGNSEIQIRHGHVLQSLKDTIIVEPTLESDDKVITSTLGIVLPGQKASIVNTGSTISDQAVQ